MSDVELRNQILDQPNRRYQCGMVTCWQCRDRSHPDHYKDHQCFESISGGALLDESEWSRPMEVNRHSQRDGDGEMERRQFVQIQMLELTVQAGLREHAAGH